MTKLPPFPSAVSGSQKSSRIRSGTRSAVTLLELLAATAIVAILAALLIPVTANLRQLSAKAACLANLRVLHQALAQYAADHAGAYPAPTDNPLYTGATTGSWTLALLTGEYLGPVKTLDPTKNVFLCPAARQTYDEGRAYRTYGMNTLPFTAHPIYPVKLSQPSRTIILADASDGGAHTGDAFFYFRTNSMNRIDNRHSGKFNALFVDGHIEPLGKTDPATAEAIDNLNK